jgi:anti-sigma-K factor RskA
MTMSDDHTIHDLLPGFALGCLDPGDEAAVKEHLPSCAACREELESFVQVVDRLARTVPAADPPVSLEGRVLGAAGAPVRKPLRFLRRAAVGAKAARPSPWRPALGAMAAVAIAALALGNLLQWAGVIRPRGAAGSAPLVTVALAGTEAARGAFGTVVLDAADREGVLAVTGLPLLDAGRQYQLWLIRGAERRSAGVFSVDAEGYGSLLLAVPTDFRDFRGLGISVEPAGGSPAPTGPRVMAGSL